jgi:hypothetical protein
LLTRIDDLKREKAALDKGLDVRNHAIEALSAKIESAAVELASVRLSQKQGEQSLRRQASELSEAREENAAIAGERDGANRRLQQAVESLAKMKASLDGLREERASEILRTASLETRIGDLSARVKEGEEKGAQDEQFLASNRDIRELMGARDLYIADVFDVDPDGHTEKPFGRVFYTRGKSLIFYAFDLDRQHSVRNASTFQAWGRHGIDDNRPLNMGIFYLDSETNRRWVLKFDDPEALARIDTVFVTVEPKGGSREPRGKPLLLASLKSQPNHP